MKIAYPVSIDENIVDWINEQVNGGAFRNRSHLVEFALQQFKGNTGC